MAKACTLVCPECHEALQEKEDLSRYCKKCERLYKSKNGIVSFLESADSFYEGMFMDTLGKKDNILWGLYSYLNMRLSIAGSRERFINKILLGSKDLKILDLACGGGNEFLCEHGTVVGIDISVGSLMKAKKIYNEVIHSTVLKLPFPDDEFDFVFSSWIYEHLLSSEKELMLAEIYRVLKKGGKTAHVIACESNSLYFRFAKSHPELFKRYFVDRYGHVGLEVPTKVFARFRNHGFLPILEIADPCKGYLREVVSYPMYFDNEYQEKSFVIKFLVRVCKLFKNRYVTAIINMILGMFVPLADLFTPIDHRDSAKVFYVKESKH